MFPGCEPIWSSQNTLQAEEPFAINTARWPLAKYAIYTSENVWKDQPIEQGKLWLQINQAKQIQILQGYCLLESFSPLQDPISCVRGAYRDAVLLLTCETNDASRKCRVRFASYRDISDQDMRIQCTEQLAKIILLQDLDNPQDEPMTEADSPLLSGTVPLSDVAQILLKPAAYNWPPAYAKIEQEDDRLSGLIRCCLMEPSFPRLVEQVEKILRSIIVNEDN